MVRIKFSGMENQFKPDDKVLTKIKGAEVETTVRLIWNNEVQVKCPDGSLRWRTSKTVWFPMAQITPASSPVPSPEVPALAEPLAPTEEPAPSAEAPVASGEVEVAPPVTSVEVGTGKTKRKRSKNRK